MKTPADVRFELGILATQATELGYQVTYQTTTVTEGHAAGSKTMGITISTIAQEDHHGA